jgi:hypothetical protein
VDEDGEDISSCVVCPVDAGEGATKESGPRLTNAEEIGLRALKEALAEVGQHSVTNRAPPDVTAVTVETWREYAYRLGMVDNDAKADAKRQAFYRVRTKLQVLGIIGIDGEWTWIGRKNT